jgi:hypothetical protein
LNLKDILFFLTGLCVDDAASRNKGKNLLDLSERGAVESHTGIEFRHPSHEHGVVVTFHGIMRRDARKVLLPEADLSLKGGAGDGEVRMGQCGDRGCE